MILPNSLLIALCAAVPLLALVSPFHLTFILSIVTGIIPGQFDVSGVLFDPTDVVMLGLFLALITRSRISGLRLSRSIPFFRLWASLVLLVSMAYLTSPFTSDYLTDPIRAVYQLYRYSWRELLFYPLAVLLLRDKRKTVLALSSLTILFILSAVQAILEGYGGDRTGGFVEANAVGSSYMLAILLCLAVIISSSRGWYRVLGILSVLILVRAVLFSGSRGSYISILGGLAVFGIGLVSRREFRANTLVLGFAAVVVGFLTVIAVPNLAERPSIQRFLTVTSPLEQSTMQWRMQERWPRYIELVRQNPFFGMGTTVDPELEEGAVTPHNGYLSIAVRQGIPALCIYVAFFVIGIRRGIRRLSTEEDPHRGLLALVVASTLTTILLHNMVESTIVNPIVVRQFWLAAALSVQTFTTDRKGSTNLDDAKKPT